MGKWRDNVLKEAFSVRATAGSEGEWCLAFAAHGYSVLWEGMCPVFTHGQPFETC